MFEPLFKKEAEPPPPKGVSIKEWDKQLQKGPKPCCKTAAPITLIRKVAEELGPTKEEREAALQKEESKLTRRVLRDKSQGTARGLLGGAALGGIAGALAGGKEGRFLAVPGITAGALLGASTGAALSGNEKTRAAQDRLNQIRTEARQLAAMKPEARGPLTDETLDREGYQQARADVARARLALKDVSSPIMHAGVVGTGLGALLGGAHGYTRTGVTGALKGVASGALIGSTLGATARLGLMGDKGQRRLEMAAQNLRLAQEPRNRIWEGAATLDAPIQDIRKAASKLAFEELTGPASTSTEDLLRQEKLASVADEQLLKIAMDLNTFRGVDGYGVSIDGALQTYEDLGGKYKQAFGQPMFNPQQMAGSPALAGGTAQRATKPTLSMQQVQPTQSPATASPRAQAQTVSTPSAPAQTQAPSAAPAAASAPAVSVSMG